MRLETEVAIQKNLPLFEADESEPGRRLPRRRPAF
jgi:hypothetical protein